MEPPDRRQCKQPPYLICIRGPARDATQLRRIEIRPQGHRHGKPPSFALLESNHPRVGEAPRVAIREGWY